MSNPSLLCVPYRFKTSKLYSQIPDSGLGDFVVTRSASNSATRVNSAGFIETVADNVPRLDYPLGGITAGCPALLVEPAATNGIRNNSMVGAVVGSPGTIPTNWILGGVGLVQQIVAVGTENGVSYIDLRLSGTATANTATLSFESSTQIAALTGQTWTISSYLKTIALPSPPTSFVLAITERTSGGALVAQQSANVSLTSTLARYSYSPTLNGGATTAFAQPRLFFALVIGQAYDFTIRVGYPQMEQGSVATSVIPTTTVAITRGAEVVDRTGISSLMGQTQGTFYLDMSYFAKGASGTTLWLYIIGTPTSNNIGLAVLGTSVRSIVNGQNDILSTPSTANGVKIAWGYDGSGVVCFVNGVQYNLPNGGNQIITSMNRCVIDMSSAGGIRMADVRIRAIELYPTRLPNTGPLSLQSLTQ